MRFTGIVTTYFPGRKYGFVTSDTDGVSRFVHAANCINPIQVGMKVEFEIGPPNKLGKGEQCLNVQPYGWVESAIRPRVDASSEVSRGK